MSIPVIEDLKLERARQNISIADLCEASGVSEATLSKTFSGKADNPTVSTVSDIAVVLGLEARAVTPSAEQSIPGDTELIERLINRISLEQSKVAAEKDKMVARLEGGIQSRNRCILVLFWLIVVAMAFLVAYLIFDIRNGNCGFIRYAKETTTNLIPGVSGFRTDVL